jgi:streptomycin 6-kinase
MTTGKSQNSLLHPYLDRWQLSADGPPIVTPRAVLLPVRQQDRAAMLKVATDAEEKFGNLLLSWWAGNGAAAVFAASDDAILMERAMGQRSLTAYAQGGRDDEATAILCDVVARLHRPRSMPLSQLVPLDIWFADLFPTAAAQGGILARAAATAQALLVDQRDVRPLHADIHHDNVLDFDDRGWLAIDPKRVIGEPGYDYANIFCNPDMDHPVPPVAVLPERFQRRLEIVTSRSGIPRRRLTEWILAYTGLSAAWIIQDGDDPAVDLAVAAFAATELDR